MFLHHSTVSCSDRKNGGLGSEVECCLLFNGPGYSVTLVPCDTFILWPEFRNLHHLCELSRKQFQAHKFVGQFTYGAQLNASLLGP